MIELTGITWDHPRGYAPLAASEATYEQAHGVRIHWDKRSLKDFGDSSIAELARQYDLIVMDHPHVGIAAEAACLRPLDTCLPSPVLTALSQQSAGPSYGSYHYAGHQWALPLDAACQVSARRPDLLEASFCPDDWDAVFALQEPLHKQGMQIGMALCPTDCLCSFLTLCAQFGDGPKEGRPALVEPTVGLRALEQLRRLRDTCHPDSLQWNPIQLFDAMARPESRIAYAPLAFGYTNYARRGYAAHPLGFGSIPGGHSALLGGAGLAVSAHCAAPAEAAAYIAHIASADYQCSAYVEHGGQPANGIAHTDPTADALAGGFLSGTRSTLEQAYMRPRNAAWPAFQENLGERLHSFLKNDESDPATVIKELQERYHPPTPK